ncbi:PREDICTED: LOW QUALITY PROTEIN: uncharacterized protein LOC103600016 [Galeopterus variegatus]|uniref:LOW QUALITY PROTEIN: uncharacterized protein LOC103600016 n=1 Tax=Galeopterus variegatus TaxID=482537 RepID=A0ABM0RPC0_GALVR|nr:PREDICTED: LOW QUALITY PROTEIN: uncharacterized protein LOC103600016 [Galeopterus variegatus]
MVCPVGNAQAPLLSHQHKVLPHCGESLEARDDSDTDNSSPNSTESRSQQLVVAPSSQGLRLPQPQFLEAVYARALGHIVLFFLVMTPQWRWNPSKTPNVAVLPDQRCSPGGHFSGGVSLCPSHSLLVRLAALPNLWHLQQKLSETGCKGRCLCPGQAGNQTRGHSACVRACVCVSVSVEEGGGGTGRKTGTTSATKDPRIIKRRLRVINDRH